MQRGLADQEPGARVPERRYIGNHPHWGLAFRAVRELGGQALGDDATLVERLRVVGADTAAAGAAVIVGVEPRRRVLPRLAVGRQRIGKRAPRGLELVVVLRPDGQAGPAD